MRQNRRDTILEAGISILREQGLSGLTQPRVVAKTGLRQSHLTYYYPTRADLLEAVARRAMELQVDALKALLLTISTPAEAARKIASVVCRAEITRVLAALNQAADLEPAVRASFTELQKEFVRELAAFLNRLGLPFDHARVDIFHSLFVGLSIINLATGRPDAEQRTEAVFNLAFQLLSGKSS